VWERNIKVKISVQTDNLKLLQEAVESGCDSVRFGSEFCMYNMPSLDNLERAYEIVHGGGKEFTYVTPRLSNNGIEMLRKQLALLNKRGEVDIVFNDMGALNIIGNYQNLRPHLGRLLVRVPARSPWIDRAMVDEGLFAWRLSKKIFSSTSLNYPLTIEFFQNHYNVRDVDVDWIPRVFPSFDFLAKRGFNIHVHFHLVPVTFTRKCHTARFLGEERVEECSKPCLEKAFLLKKSSLELFLHGNAVFNLVQPDRAGMRELIRNKTTEFILTMNPITGIDNRQKIDDFIKNVWN
jgi:hypothetical protein